MCHLVNTKLLKLRTSQYIQAFMQDEILTSPKNVPLDAWVFVRACTKSRLNMHRVNNISFFAPQISTPSTKILPVQNELWHVKLWMHSKLLESRGRGMMLKTMSFMQHHTLMFWDIPLISTVVFFITALISIRLVMFESNLQCFKCVLITSLTTQTCCWNVNVPCWQVAASGL